MSFTIENHTNYYLDDTQVPNIFIAEYMPVTPGDFVKVYLFAYMRAMRGDVTSNESIASALGMETEDVLAAWTHFEGRGLVKKRHLQGGDRLHYDVVFRDLKGMLFGGSSDEESEAGGSGAESLRAAMGEAEVRELFRRIETMVGRTLSGTDIGRVGALLDDGADPALILFAFKYCRERRNNTRMPYVAEVVRRWFEDGVRTPEDAEAHILGSDLRMDQYRQIMGALGLHFSSITDAEKQVFDGWLDRMGFTVDEILVAAEKAAGKRNKYDYVKKILDNQYEDMTSGGLNAVNGGAGAVGAPGRGKAAERDRYYVEARARAEAAAEAHRREVYERVPAVEGFDKDIVRLNKESVSAIMSRTDGGRSEYDKIAVRIERKLAERNMAMKEAGYPEDYMEIHFHCAKCRDTGIMEDGGACDCFQNLM